MQTFVYIFFYLYFPLTYNPEIDKIKETSMGEFHSHLTSLYYNTIHVLRSYIKSDQRILSYFHEDIYSKHVGYNTTSTNNCDRS